MTDAAARRAVEERSPLVGGPALRVNREEAVAGPVPRYRVPRWREEYGVVAGITARGSESGAGFDLGLWTREPVSEVMGRWRAFREAEPGFVGFGMAHQVHGAELVWHAAGPGWTVVDAADGHFTEAPGRLLLVTVADCIPVYLAVPGRMVGVLHAGWRGTAAGIVERGVAELARAAGVPPRNIVAHLGVGICGACYEVGSEVMAGCGVPADGPGPWQLDLRSILADRAGRAGVGEITVSPWCSAHDRPRFYSHRASGGTDGRMAAFIGLPRTDSVRVGD
jgi:YfiH family protein